MHRHRCCRPPAKMTYLVLVWTTVTCFCWTSGSAQEPVRYPEINGSEALACVCHQDPCDVFLWFRILKNESQQFLLSVNTADRIYHNPGLDKSRFTATMNSGKSTLRIANLMREDNAMYSCVSKSKLMEAIWAPGVVLLPGVTPPEPTPKPTSKPVCRCREKSHKLHRKLTRLAPQASPRGWPQGLAPGAGPTKMAPGALTDASMWILMAFWFKKQIILNIADCPFTFQSECPYPYQVYIFSVICVTGYDAVLTLNNILCLFSKGLWLRCLVAIGGNPGELGPGASRHTVLLQPVTQEMPPPLCKERTDETKLNQSI